MNKCMNIICQHLASHLFILPLETLFEIPGYASIIILLYYIFCVVYITVVNQLELRLYCKKLPLLTSKMDMDFVNLDFYKISLRNHGISSYLHLAGY